MIVFENDICHTLLTLWAAFPISYETQCNLDKCYTFLAGKRS